MKEDLLDIRERIAENRYADEAAVSSGIVQRVLSTLGWPIFNVEVVCPQYPLKTRRVDFALCHPSNKPVVFIKVKRLGSSAGADQQLFEYAYYEGVQMALLTDGREWHFYLPAEHGKYDERRVYMLDLLERSVDESEDRLKRYLNYRDVCTGKALDAAREDYRNVSRERQIQETLPEAWTKLVADEDEYLLDALATKVESLCGFKPDPDTVASFLKHKVELKTTDTGLRSSSPPIVAPPPTASRSVSGTFEGRTYPAMSVTIEGRTYPESTARGVLIKTLELLAEHDPTFLDRFVARPIHGRKRRYLARSKYELYPGRKDLAEEFSHELRRGWWVGVNLSKSHIEQVIKMACDTAGLRFGQDVQINLNM